jgi:N utilization substance protein A
MPAEDLLTLEGMSPDLALALARRGVRTRADLADQAVDDLADIEGLSAEEAGEPDHEGARAAVLGDHKVKTHG